MNCYVSRLFPAKSFYSPKFIPVKTHRFINTQAMLGPNKKTDTIMSKCACYLRTHDYTLTPELTRNLAAARLARYPLTKDNTLYFAGTPIEVSEKLIDLPRSIRHYSIKKIESSLYNAEGKITLTPDSFKRALSALEEKKSRQAYDVVSEAICGKLPNNFATREVKEIGLKSILLGSFPNPSRVLLTLSAEEPASFEDSQTHLIKGMSYRLMCLIAGCIVKATTDGVFETLKMLESYDTCFPENSNDLNLADIKYAHSLKRSIESLESAIHLNPRLTEAYHYLLPQYLEKKDIQAAKKLAREITTNFEGSLGMQEQKLLFSAYEVLKQE